MIVFRALLGVLLASIITYTGVVITNHGLGLAPVFWGDMMLMGWPGQFDLDFMFMLTLSALWVAWRHQFSGVGILLSVLALVGGSLFLTLYLLVLTLQADGSMKQVLLGKARVQGDLA